MMTRTFAYFAAASMAAALAGCGGGGKTYDISPIFPASDPAAKCAKYDGDLQGSGITATCMVTQAECEKAAADWRNAMQTGGVNDAIQFSCK
ncbi:MAG: hypothetical protein ACLP50_05345 [Solirubrobacteraceae bacterium]